MKISALLLLLCLILIISNIYEVTARPNLPEKDSYSYPVYRAAVVEFAPFFRPFPLPVVSKDEALAIMSKNMRGMAEQAAAAASGLSDIVIFPEDALYGPAFEKRDQVLPYLQELPAALVNTIPCLNASLLRTSPVIYNYSAIARANKMYLVGTLGVKEPCSRAIDPKCPSDGRYQWNTQVAFDRYGTLLAVYHKTHLFFEKQYDAAPETQSNVKSFNTDFGVRFGMFICFDMLFDFPAQRNLDEGITHYAMSMWWVNDQTLSSLQAQQAWSRFFNVTFLSSNTGASWFQSGSGIYVRGIPVRDVYNIDVKRVTTLLIADVPIDYSAEIDADLERRNALALKRRKPSRLLAPTPLDVSETYKDARLHPIESLDAMDYAISVFAADANSSSSISATHHNLTCKLDYTVSSQSFPFQYFGLVAFSGVYRGIVAKQTCALVRCGKAAPEHCASFVFASATVFDHVRITGNFNPTYRTLLRTAATSDLWVLPNSFMTYIDQGVESTTFTEPLLAMSLHAFPWREI